MKECMNCGEDISKGGHYVPPCFGDIGFFHCKPKGICVTCNGERTVENSTSGFAHSGKDRVDCPACVEKD